MDIRIRPKKLCGSINIPPSKSMAHRMIICASLATLSCDHDTNIENIAMSDDILATIGAMRSLGLEIEKDLLEGGRYRLKVSGIDGSRNDGLADDYLTIDCGESGSTLRFIIPILSVFAKRYGLVNYRLDTRGRLLQRPLDPYFDILDREGIDYNIDGTSLYIRGMKGFSQSSYEIDGGISSQFISGLLFSLPLMDFDTDIVIKNRLESRGYVDMTLDALYKYGIEVENIDYKTFKIKGNQSYKPVKASVEGDYSQAAFFLVANALGNKVQIKGLDPGSLQLDKEIVDIIGRYDKYYCNEGGDRCIASDLAIGIDATNIPDIVPIMSLLATNYKYPSKISGVERLRIKESDRLQATSSQLRILGKDIEIIGEKEETSLLINGNLDRGNKDQSTGDDYYLVDSFKDHRIAMTLAIAATVSDKDLVIKDAHVVSKSYPNFWDDYKKLGGEVYEFDLG